MLYLIAGKMTKESEIMQDRRVIYIFFIGISLLSQITSSAFAKKSYEQQVEAWLNNEIDDLPSQNINGGKLKFFKEPPKQKVHHHHNTLFVAKKSMDSGWIKLLQCHENMDSFPSAQVVYNVNKVKNIKITRTKNIGKAWVDKSSVQLQNVKKNAQLCIEIDSKALHKNKDGSFSLRNGPFMRKFLDGFFPMRVSFDLKLPKELKFVSISPNQQDGFRVKKTDTGLHFDAWFEGKLYTNILLHAVKK